MKFLLFLIGIAGSAALGYYLEPELRTTLTGKPKSDQAKVTNASSDSGNPDKSKNVTTEQEATVPVPITLAPPVPQPPQQNSNDSSVTPTPAPIVEPEVVAPVKPDPKPEPAPPVEEPTVTLTSEEIIALMKQQIAAGTVQAITTKQVTNWKSSTNEEIDGETYQIGILAYQVDSFLGSRNFEAKALIKDGNINRWVSAISGLVIE